jgi:hypothetical protein
MEIRDILGSSNKPVGKEECEKESFQVTWYTAINVFFGNPVYCLNMPLLL